MSNNYVIPVIAVFSDVSLYEKTPLSPCTECGKMVWESVYVPAWQRKLSEVKQELFICSGCRDHWYSILSMTLRQIYNEKRAMSGHLQAVLGMVGFRSFDPVRSGSIPCPNCLSSSLSAYITNTQALFRVSPYSLPVSIPPTTVLANCRRVKEGDDKRIPEEVKVGLKCDVCDYDFSPQEIKNSLQLYEECESLYKRTGFGVYATQRSTEHDHHGKAVDPNLTLVLYIYKAFLKNEAPSVQRLLFLFPQISREMAGRLVFQATKILDRPYANISCVA